MPKRTRLTHKLGRCYSPENSFHTHLSDLLSIPAAPQRLREDLHGVLGPLGEVVLQVWNGIQLFVLQLSDCRGGHARQHHQGGLLRKAGLH